MQYTGMIYESDEVKHNYIGDAVIEADFGIIIVSILADPDYNADVDSLDTCKAFNAKTIINAALDNNCCCFSLIKVKYTDTFLNRCALLGVKPVAQILNIRGNLYCNILDQLDDYYKYNQV